MFRSLVVPVICLCLFGCEHETLCNGALMSPEGLRSAGWKELVPDPAEAVHDVTVLIDGNDFELGGSAGPERWESPDGRSEKLLLDEMHCCDAVGGPGPMSLDADVRLRHEVQTSGKMASIARITISVDYSSHQGRRTNWRHAADVALSYPVVLAGNGVRVIVERRPN